MATCGSGVPISAIARTVSDVSLQAWIGMQQSVQLLRVESRNRRLSATSKKGTAYAAAL